MSYVLSPAHEDALTCADAGPFATWGQASGHRAAVIATHVDRMVTIRPGRA